jgi:hypothetical protein
MRLLFIIVQLTAIFIKVLARPATLDAALQAVEFVEKEGVNNWANAKAAAVQRAAQVAAALEAAALQRLKNNLLQKVAAAPVFDLTQLEQAAPKQSSLLGARATVFISQFKEAPTNPLNEVTDLPTIGKVETPKQGRGVYEVAVGQESNGSVFAKGCGMEVTWACERLVDVRAIK